MMMTLCRKMLNLLRRAVISIFCLLRYIKNIRAKELEKGCLKPLKLELEKIKGCVIDDILTSVVTKQGENLIKKHGFKLINDYTKISQYKLYQKDGKDI